MTPPTPTTDQVRTQVRTFILQTCLPGAAAEELQDDTPLVSGGIVDSLVTIRLVAELEDRYRITIRPHEAGVAYLDTVRDIVALVMSKV